MYLIIIRNEIWFAQEIWLRFGFACFFIQNLVYFHAD